MTEPARGVTVAQLCVRWQGRSIGSLVYGQRAQPLIDGGYATEYHYPSDDQEPHHDDSAPADPD